MRRRSLPRVVISVPCPADWGAMEPITADGRARFCGRCDKPVYDSKAMGRGELLALIARIEGPAPCVRLHLRPDGTVVTRDCFARLRQAGRHLWAKIAVLGMAFWGGVWATRRGTAWSTLAADLVAGRGDAAADAASALSPTEATGHVPLGMIGLRVPRAPRRRDPSTVRPADIDKEPPLRALASEEAMWDWR